MNEVPNSINEAADLAEQLHAKMYPQEEAVDEAIPEEPVDNSQDVNNDDDRDVPHDDDIAELRKFKDKYLSLKGKYDSEVPTLHKELKEFKQNVFERLEQTRQPEPDAPAVDKFAKFKEEYGEDLFEAIKDLASQQAEERFKTALQPVQQQVSSVEETQIKSAQNNFVNYLDQTVKGDWQNLWAGNDPKFIEFLQQPDPSGLYTYGDLVQVYNDNWDADKLTKVFNHYFDVNSVQKTPEPRVPRPEQNAMVAPSRSTQHVSPATNDKQIWTQAAMNEFQAKDRRGAYSSEESKAMWDDLLAAMGEGRIRG